MKRTFWIKRKVVKDHWWYMDGIVEIQTQVVTVNDVSELSMYSNIIELVEIT